MYKEYLEVEEFTRHQLQIMKDIACILLMKNILCYCWSNVTIQVQIITLLCSLLIILVVAIIMNSSLVNPLTDTICTR
jgi:hypothetical protein